MDNTRDSMVPYFDVIPTEMITEIFKNIPTFDLFLNVSKVCFRFKNIIYSQARFKRNIFIKSDFELNDVLWVLSQLGPNLHNLIIERRPTDFMDILFHAIRNNPNLVKIELQNSEAIHLGGTEFISRCYGHFPNLEAFRITSYTLHTRNNEDEMRAKAIMNCPTGKSIPAVKKLLYLSTLDDPQ